MNPSQPSSSQQRGTLALLGLSPAAWGALLALLAIALGAFGAHALKAHISAERLDTFEVAVRYQMYHALALLALYALPRHLWRVAPLWLYGSVIFSGSLYVLVFTGIGILGAITPIGGVLQIAGWLWLFILLMGTSKNV